jgi:predicted MFS family arabinose efflux permease
MTGQQALPPRTRWGSVLLLWGCGVGSAMQFAKMSVGFDAVMAHFQLSLAQTGLLLSVIGTVGLLLGATAGVLVGRRDPRTSLLAALALGGLLSMVQAALPPLAVFALSRVAEGVSHLVIVIVAPILMNAFSAPRHRALAMGLWGTFFGVAFSLASLLGGPLLARHGVQGLLLGHGAFLWVLAGAVWLATPAAPHRPAGGPTAAGESMRRFAARHVQIYSRRATALPGLLFLFHTCMFIALLTFVPRLVDERERASLEFVMPLFGVAGTLGAGLLAQHAMTPVRLAAACFAAVAAAALGLHWMLVQQGAVVPAALGLLFVSGLVQGAVFTTVPFLARTPEEQAGALGAIAQLGNLGATVGPPAMAWSYGAHGPPGLTVPVLLLAAGGMALAAAASRRAPAPVLPPQTQGP